MHASVVIPMYNAERTILETLQALERQRVEGFDVIVVDDGSTDSSAGVVAGFKRHSRLPVTLVQREPRGPAAARNVGARQAQGDVIVFLDSDCIPAANWLKEMTRPLGHGVVACNCGYRVKNANSLVARYVDCEIARRHERLIGRDINTIGSYSAAFLRSTFLDAGGFDSEYTAPNAEDFDLGYRIRRNGGKLAFTARTYVYHYHPDSVRKYLKQQFTRGYWRVKMYLDNRDVIVQGDSYTGHDIQFQFFLSNLVLFSLVLGVFSRFLPILALGILILSNLRLGAWAWQRERKLLVLAPLLASLRSLAGTFGVYAYLLSKVLGK